MNNTARMKGNILLLERIWIGHKSQSVFRDGKWIMQREQI